MAQKIVTVCDLDKCGREDARTTPLGFNGTDVELDLCPAHHQAVADALAELLAAGRPVKKTRGPYKRRTTTPAQVVPTAAADGEVVDIPKRIDHRGHKHPMTKQGKKACRQQMLEAAGVAS